MKKRFGLMVFSIFLAAVLMTGCKPHPPSAPVAPSGYFQTPFQDESQYIVEAIVSDLAEQMYYAANHRLPDPGSFQVTAVEKPGSPLDAPVYDLDIRLDPKLGALKSSVNVNGPIWSPAVYKDLATQLGSAVGLTVTNAGTWRDTSLLSKLTDNTAETIEQENEQLSGALEQDFTDPQLHEKAAALLGAFMLRDHSGHFFDIRAPLSRMTAHLTMAQFLNGTNAYGINGQMAEAMLFTLINDESLSLDQLNAIGTNEAAVAPLVRALWTRDTGDYRLLGAIDNLTPVESVEWFCAMASSVSAPVAWPKLSDVERHTIDYVRVANESKYSVEMGHDLYDASLRLEYREIESIYKIMHHQPLAESGLADALNQMPERCFATTPDGSVHVCVIGWGQWANFLQRHLCHAIQSNFDCLLNRWGLPDDAKAFASKCDADFSGLRLYPFVERYNATDVNTYHKSVDDGLKETMATPQLTPAECWNHLFYSVDFASRYCPNPNPHLNEWHHHDPSPGTVYDLYARLNQPGLYQRPDIAAVIEKLHQLAPYDFRVLYYIMMQKYGGHPGYAEATNLYQRVLPYSLAAVQMVANSVTNDPDRYEHFLLQAAQLDPGNYFTLGDYELARHEEDHAATDYDKGADADPDAVEVASYASWRVRYYLKKGDIFKARAVADFAGEVYSYDGLDAEGIYFEAVSNYPEAFDWYKKIEDRYNDSGELIGFCVRHKALTGDTQFDQELQDQITKLFPKGLEKVSLADFQGPPTDGVLIQEQNDLLRDYGLRQGDVIVALGGTRTHTFNQYTSIRASLTGPELDLIVWQSGVFHEIKASPPNLRFGADFGDYTSQ